MSASDDLQTCASEAEDKRLSLLMHPDTPSSRFRVLTGFFLLVIASSPAGWGTILLTSHTHPGGY